MRDDRASTRDVGVHVHSRDSAERAGLIACLRSCGIPYRAESTSADLVLFGAVGTTTVELIEQARKHPHRPFALCGDEIGPELLRTASRSGAIAILPRPSLAHRFRVELDCALSVAAELARLHQSVIAIEGSGSNLESVPAAPALTSADDLLAERLRRAVETKAFELHYQPKANSDTRALVGFEALIRWQDAECGRVSPEVFIPLAESLGLIEQIGSWCIRTAAQQVVRWREMGLDPGRVAVNASPLQFGRRDFTSWLLETLAEAGQPLESFELEVTEGCLLESGEAIATLKSLAAAGVHIAIDDFGTGYSSLQYLRDLPIESVKMDRAFVIDLEEDAAARSLAAAIISLAWNLGFRVVAEGVETDFQWRFLADHGCDVIQGYHFSRPLPVAAAEALMRDALGSADSR